jgi:hypothetical protein
VKYEKNSFFSNQKKFLKKIMNSNLFSSLPGTIPFTKIPDVSGGCKCMLKDKKINGGGLCNFCKIQSILGGGISGGETIAEVGIKGGDFLDDLDGGEEENNMFDSGFNGGEFDNQELDGGVTNYLNLTGLSPTQQKKFRAAANQLRKNSDYAYLNANKGLVDANQVRRSKRRSTQQKYLKEVLIDEDARNFAYSSPRTQRAAQRARSQTRKMMKRPYKAITNERLADLNYKTNEVLRDVLEDNVPVFTRRSPKMYGSGMCSSLTPQQLGYAASAVQGVPNMWKAFQMSITPSMKNRLKRSPTFAGLQNSYQREVAALWNMAKTQCV